MKTLSSLLLLSTGISSAMPENFRDTGKAACPCLDSAALLASKNKKKACHLQGNNNNDNGTEGALFHHNDDCYPLDYGSNECAMWDNIYADACTTEENPPGWCRERWCFIDPDRCHSSHEPYYRSNSHPELFYSYSTCGGDGQGWLKYETTQQTNNLTLKVGIPEIWYPVHYKLDADKNLVENGSPDAFDTAVPWKGAVIDYFNDVVEISNIRSVQYVHRSGGSSRKNITSIYTQAISDVEVNVVDMVAGTLWVTAERLEIAPFTVPILTDTFKLWVPNGPADDGTTVAMNFYKLRQPFSNELWLSIFLAIVSYAILSAYVSPKKFRTFQTESKSKCKKLKRAALVLTDSINLSALEFLGGGVDTGSVELNLSQKWLNFGFALVTFITITAYTANLAAFLTLSGASGQITSIEQATAAHISICAPFNIRKELLALHPKSHFVFGPDNEDVQADYDQGKCGAIVQGWVDIRIEPDAQLWYCKRGLSRVGPTVLEFQVAFPGNRDLIGGLSYWIAEAKNQGILFEHYIDRIPALCQLEGGQEENEDENQQQFTVSNMAVPLMVFCCCCGLALITHFFKICYYRKGNKEKGARAILRKSLGISKRFVGASKRALGIPKDRSEKDIMVKSFLGLAEEVGRQKQPLKKPVTRARFEKGPEPTLDTTSITSRTSRGEEEIPFRPSEHWTRKTNAFNINAIHVKTSPLLDAGRIDSMEDANRAMESFLAYQRQSMEELMSYQHMLIRRTQELSMPQHRVPLPQRGRVTFAFDEEPLDNVSV